MSLVWQCILKTFWAVTNRWPSCHVVLQISQPPTVPCAIYVSLLYNALLFIFGHSINRVLLRIYRYIDHILHKCSNRQPKYSQYYDNANKQKTKRSSRAQAFLLIFPFSLLCACAPQIDSIFSGFSYHATVSIRVKTPSKCTHRKIYSKNALG